MKITLIPDNIGKMGGTRSFLLRVLSINYNNNIESTLIIQEHQADDKLLEYCVALNVNYIIVKSRTKLYMKPYFSLLYDFYIYYLVKLKSSPDVILTSIGTPRLFYGFFFFKTPLIYFVHTYPSKSSYKSKAMNLISKYLPSRQKRIVTVSEYSKNAIIDFMYAKKEFVDVIYNSVSVADKINTQNKNKIVLTVGHIVEYKNPLVWYEVAKKVINRLPDTKFYWVGEGGLLETMKLKVTEDDLIDKIFFVGMSNEVNMYYRIANVYFHPSLIENHSIAIIEAMSHGIPCVASNVGGTPESIIDLKTGYLSSPYDVEKFSDDICSLLVDHNKGENMGSEGFKEVVKKFSNERQEQKILDIYKSFLVPKCPQWERR